MTTSTDALLNHTANLAEVWGCALGGGVLAGEPDAGLDVERMTDAGLVASLDAVFAVKRQVEALLVRVAGQVAVRFREDSGVHGIAARTGNRSAPALVAERGHITVAEAGRVCRVGEATRPRMSVVGQRLPAEYAQVAAALTAGALPVDSAQFIIANLSQASPRATAEDLDEAEQALVDFAVANEADSVRKLAIRYRDALDVDGVEPREAELVARRSLKRSVLPNGMKRYVFEADPLSAAFFDTAIDALVGAALRTPRFEAAADGAEADADGCDENHVALEDGRSIEQLGFDAFVDILRHGLSCTEGLGPLNHTTVVVRMSLESLLTGLGEAQLDGIEQPISARTARCLAADAGIIPLVLGGRSEVLDFGRARRYFTRAQKLAMAERDGGCATRGCNRPPSYTEGHHALWFKRDGGRTNLSNGVLLCSACHHRMHREGWDVRITNNVVWFIPPASVDPHRQPRRGGKPPLPTPTGHNQPRY